MDLRNVEMNIKVKYKLLQKEIEEHKNAKPKNLALLNV
jgi:hypothetical protein